jgi:hypothetical protein
MACYNANPPKTTFSGQGGINALNWTKVLSYRSLREDVRTANKLDSTKVSLCPTCRAAVDTRYKEDDEVTSRLATRFYLGTAVVIAIFIVTYVVLHPA